VRRTPAQSSRARVENTATLGDEFRIGWRPGFFAIVADEEIPFHCAVFGRECVKGGSLVIEREPIDVWLERIAAGELARVASGFEHHDFFPGFG